MATMFQMQQEGKNYHEGDETAFFVTLKLAVVRRRFLILEKLILQLAGEGIWVERTDQMMRFDKFYF